MHGRAMRIIEQLKALGVVTRPTAAQAIPGVTQEQGEAIAAMFEGDRGLFIEMDERPGQFDVGYASNDWHWKLRQARNGCRRFFDVLADPTLYVTGRRQARFEAVREGYEADGPDVTVPGAADGPTRYCVVTESSRGHGYFVNYASSLEDVERVAAANIGEGWWPVCYFDLDVLAGDEPIIVGGDVVMYQGKRRVVSHHDYESAEGQPYPVVYLEQEEAEEEGYVPEGPLDPQEDGIELVERGMPDERMPVRYGLAKIVTHVVFNTEPTHA